MNVHLLSLPLPPPNTHSHHHTHSPRAILDVVVKPRSGQSGPGERMYEELISKTCETVVKTSQHPHTAISITLQVENDAGSVSGREGEVR
jgi:hypothetical protein